MMTLILLHGALGSKFQLKALESSLSNHFDVHSFNFSGHGGQPFSNFGFGIETFSHELKDYIVLNKLKGAHVFGFSMGGYVTLKLAQTNPDLIGKIFTLGTKFNWNPLSAGQEALKLKPEVIEEKVPQFAAILDKLHTPLNWKEVVIKTKDMMLGLGQNPLLNKSELLEITNDCIIARGEMDEMVSKEETEWAANHLHFGQPKELPDTRHPFEKVDIDLLAAELKAFLK